GGFAVGGVALVAVDLDHRAGVEFRAVVAIVLVGVVRVHAVGVVSGNQQGALDHPGEGVAFGQYAAQHLFQHRAVGAAGGAGAHFLVGGADQHAAPVGLGSRQGLQVGVAGQQVVPARTGDEYTVQAEHRCTLGVVEGEFVIQHRIGNHAVFQG